MSRYLIRLAAVAMLALCLPVGAQAADFTFAPVADALVRSDNPTSTYGTRLEIRARSGAPEIRSYLRFDVQGVGPAVGATLRLFVTDPSASGGSISTVADTTWVESAITYNTAPPGRRS